MMVTVECGSSIPRYFNNKMMAYRFKNQAGKGIRWPVVICAALVCTYVAMLFRYGMNIPLWDDYYDLLYFFYTYLQADGVGNKFSTLFWQYTEHRNLAGRLIYLGYYYLFGELDFFWMSVVGVVILVTLAWLVGQLLKTHQDSLAEGFQPAQVIPFALLLSMAMWQGTFWAMNSISVVLFSLMLFSVFLLLKQQTTKAFVFALLMMGLIMTFGLAGFIVCLFASFYVLTSTMPGRMKKIWMVFYLPAAVIFLWGYSDYLQLLEYDRQDTLKVVVENLAGLFLVCLSFIGGLPFASGDSLWMGAAVGMLLIIASGHLLYQYWFVDRRHFYLLLSVLGVIYILVMAACIGRYLYMGEYISYASRYKQYPAVVTSLVLMSYIQLYPKPVIRFSLVVLALALTVSGYVRFLPQVVKQSEAIQEKITRWAADGSYRSLGLVGIAPHAEQILFWAIDEGLYDPYGGSRAILHLHEPPKQLAGCSMGQVETYMDVFVLGQDHSLGARVMLYNQDSHLNIQSLYLCSEQINYRLDAVDPASELSIQKTLLVPGAYALFFTTLDGRQIAINQTLVVPSQRTRQACEPEQGRGATFGLEVRKAFCQ